MKTGRFSLIFLTFLLVFTNLAWGASLKCPTPPDNIPLVEACIADTLLKEKETLKEFAAQKGHIGKMRDCWGLSEQRKSYFSDADFDKTIEGASVSRCLFNSGTDRFVCFVDLKSPACYVSQYRDHLFKRVETERAVIVVGRSSGELITFFPREK